MKSLGFAQSPHQTASPKKQIGQLLLELTDFLRILQRVCFYAFTSILVRISIAAFRSDYSERSLRDTHGWGKS